MENQPLELLLITRLLAAVKCMLSIHSIKELLPNSTVGHFLEMDPTTATRLTRGLFLFWKLIAKSQCINRMCWKTVCRQEGGCTLQATHFQVPGCPLCSLPDLETNASKRSAYMSRHMGSSFVEEEANTLGFLAPITRKVEQFG